MDQPKVTFGFVSCDRLHYLRSCVESLLYCTQDYKNKELIIVDNASVEPGTSEYLAEKEKQGIKIIRRKKRDATNWFLEALGTIVQESTGDFICPLHGDMQFLLRSNWLKEYVDFYKKNVDVVGCILLDAQRAVTNASHEPYGRLESHGTAPFLFDTKRNPVSGFGNVMYSRSVLDIIDPWPRQNTEITDHLRPRSDTTAFETKMLDNIKNTIKTKGLNWYCAVPVFPPAAGIFTDARGTNATVVKNKRYGDYWPPKEGFMYYKVYDHQDIVNLDKASGTLFSIETIAKPIGWLPPVDLNGAWKKNPIKPETAEPSDYVILYDDISEHDAKMVQDEYLDDWLET